MVEVLQNLSTAVHELLLPVAIPLMALYCMVLLVLVVYGIHRYWLVFLFIRHGGDALNRDHAIQCMNDRNGRSKTGEDQDCSALPTVTVQLPMFNEMTVAKRIIDAACQIDYPTELLQIQVLDDSIDDTSKIAEDVCKDWEAHGIDIEYIHRVHREGYKAGALEEGLQTAKGELVAVFDADFVPQPEILKQVVDNFQDQSIGMVQTRWGHINREQSPLTRSQAIFLDGHFVIEHTARHCAGRWFNFNGTAGIWRKTCIHDAGGWQHDTLTEDVDLSYRAQLRGWKFVYDPSIECPAELPPFITAFNSQQHRWTKGSIQTALKLLPSILKSSAPLGTKIEAWFHLTSPIVYIFVFLLSILVFPAFFVNITPTGESSWAGWVLGGTLLALATCSAGTFYIASQRAQGRSGIRTIIQLPLLMAVGIGISLNNSKAVFEALFQIKSGFIRTPKFADSKTNRRSTGILDPLANGRWRKITPPGFFETVIGLLLLACVVFSAVTDGTMLSIPFLLLFATGYLWVGLGSLRDRAIGAA